MKPYKTEEENENNFILNEPEMLYIVSNSLTGVFVTAVDDVMKISGYEKSQIENIMDISYKTYSRYKKDKKRLSPSHSEKLLKLKALFTLGNEVFGSKEAMALWMQKPAFGIGNLVPDDAIKTSSGIDLVMNELTNIAYGNLA